jgi:hypothetical protein
MNDPEVYKPLVFLAAALLYPAVYYGTILVVDIVLWFKWRKR